MRKLLINIGLLMLAIVLIIFVGIPGIIYGLFVHAAALPSKAFTWSLILDVLGNAMCPELFRDTLLIVRDTKFPFGVFPQTISYVLKKNFEINNLSERGLWLYNAIERIDPGHFSRVINY